MLSSGNTNAVFLMVGITLKVKKFKEDLPYPGLGNSSDRSQAHKHKPTCIQSSSLILIQCNGTIITKKKTISFSSTYSSRPAVTRFTCVVFNCNVILLITL